MFSSVINRMSKPKLIGTKLELPIIYEDVNCEVYTLSKVVESYKDKPRIYKRYS
jgi:hypothetical protein